MPVPVRSFALLLMSATLILLGTATDLAAKGVELPAGTLSAAEIVELFSGNTVESVTAVRGRTSLSYYDPSGEIRQSRHGLQRIGRWRVTESNRICLQMENLPEKCRIIIKEGDTYKKYIVRKNNRHQHSVSYTKFIDGNPFGL